MRSPPFYLLCSCRLTDLAGLPPPTDEPYITRDGISARPLFDPGAGISAVATAGGGARVRTESFSQYPRCGRAGPGVEDGSCNIIPKSEFKYMGYTVRNALWRYTAYVASSNPCLHACAR